MTTKMTRLNYEVDSYKFGSGYDNVNQRLKTNITKIFYKDSVKQQKLMNSLNDPTKLSYVYVLKNDSGKNILAAQFTTTDKKTFNFCKLSPKFEHATYTNDELKFLLSHVIESLQYDKATEINFKVRTVDKTGNKQFEFANWLNDFLNNAGLSVSCYAIADNAVEYSASLTKENVL